MPVIQITRRVEFSNKDKAYKVLIDGKLAGTIGDGETKNFDIAAGEHQVAMRFSWLGSKTVTLNLTGNETKKLETGAFRAGSLLLPIFAGLVLLHFAAKFYFNVQWILALTLPLFIPVVYYLTMGRKQYLTLTEI